MNCLLIMPDDYDRFGASKILTSFSLGICYIAAALKKRPELNVITLNLNFVEGDRAEFLGSKIIEEKIDAVLAGGLCTQAETLRRIFKIAKDINPEIATVAGGGIVTGDPVAAMAALEYADYGVIGEGDISVPELCLALKGRRAPHQVEGIIFKENDGYIPHVSKIK